MSNDTDLFNDTPIGMLEITDFTEDGKLKEMNNPAELYMGMVYANWCPPCKKAKPYYKALAQCLAKGNIQTCRLLAINATPGDRPSESALVEKLNDFFGVKGYPSFFFINAKDGKPTPLYKGDRTVEAFLNEIIKQGNAEVKANLASLLEISKNIPIDPMM